MVRTLWAAHVGRGPVAERLLDELAARYAEPHRHYHGGRHLDRVVTGVIRLGRSVGLTAAGQRAVVLAAGFHDAVYDPRSATNEADSAALARRAVADLGLGDAAGDEVARLILATAGHEPCDPGRDPNRAVLLDADLAVLGAEPAAYEAYVRGVRAEYAHVDEPAWRVGRAAVLRRFLDAPELYSTPAGRQHTARARANLTAELRSLDPPR